MTKTAIFENISTTDTLNLQKGKFLDYSKIKNLLSFKNSDVAVATNMSIKSVRFGDRMPEELRLRMYEWKEALEKVNSFFNDEEKTMLWFNTKNHFLGGNSPREMIIFGRYTKLMNFIWTALEENKK